MKGILEKKNLEWEGFQKFEAASPLPRSAMVGSLALSLLS